MKQFLQKIQSGRRLKNVVASIFLAANLPSADSYGQGVHFSQYYNAPLLLNPANTALLPDNDYRIGANFRRQWAAVPVPFQTISAYGDMQLMRNSNVTNWMGIGGAFFNDKAGNGELSLSRVEGFIAYHVQMGMTSMISFGASVASVQRTVDFNKLTYDQQWDGFAFNKNLANGEDANLQRTKYLDIGAGVNFAYFPNDAVYVKLGLGMSHLNQPQESFYGMTNKIGMRPNANLDIRLQMNPTFILNPSIYYTSQRGANQVVLGTLAEFDVTGENRGYGDTRTSLLFGAFHRWTESIIVNAGIQFNDIRLMTSYDFTISSLSPTVKGRGAMEIGLMYQGLYGDNSRGRASYGCPRF